MENIINEGALLAARKNQKFITMEDLKAAEIKVIAGPEKRSRVIPDHERRLTAWHEAGHAVVMHTLPGQDPVSQMTIVPRGQAGGMTISLPEEDRSYLSKRYLEDRARGGADFHSRHFHRGKQRHPARNGDRPENGGLLRHERADRRGRV